MLFEFIQSYWGLATLAFMLLLAVGGFLLLLLYRRQRLARLRQKLPPAFLPASQFVRVNGIRVHYVQQGKGPHLVLLHGIGASTYIWRYVFSRLAQNFTVTAVDFPGFGLSDKVKELDYGLDAQTDRTLALLNELGIDQARLVGSSMGGTIALNMALLEPERFFELAVLAPATNPKLVPPLLPLKSLTNLSSALSFTVTRATIKVALNRVINRTEIIDDKTVQAYYLPFEEKKESATTFMKAVELLRDKRLPFHFKQMRSRVLVLWGEADRMVDQKYIQELCSMLPCHQLLTRQHAGHHLMEDAPNWTYDCLSEFFKPVQD